MSKWLTLLKEREKSAFRRMGPTEPTKVGSVGFVGSYRKEAEKVNVPVTADRQHDEHISDWMDWQERAAIMEYDGGMSRKEAETEAGNIIRLQERR